MERKHYIGYKLLVEADVGKIFVQDVGTWVVVKCGRACRYILNEHECHKDISTKLFHILKCAAFRILTNSPSTRSFPVVITSYRDIDKVVYGVETRKLE